MIHAKEDPENRPGLDANYETLLLDWYEEPISSKQEIATKTRGGVITSPGKAFIGAQLLDYADHRPRKSDETFKRLIDERALERCGFSWYELNVGEFPRTA